MPLILYLLGDSLKSYHNGQKWTTYDQDNDPYNANCAVTYRGMSLAMSLQFLADINYSEMCSNNNVGCFIHSKKCNQIILYITFY